MKPLFIRVKDFPIDNDKLTNMYGIMAFTDLSISIRRATRVARNGEENCFVNHNGEMFEI